MKKFRSTWKKLRPQAKSREPSDGTNSVAEGSSRSDFTQEGAGASLPPGELNSVSNRQNEPGNGQDTGFTNTVSKNPPDDLGGSADIGDQNASKEGADTSASAHSSNATPSRANNLETAKEYLGVAGSFLGMLLKRAPDFAENPIKGVLSLAKSGIELREGMKENMDAVEQRIAATLAQLSVANEAQLLTVDNASERGVAAQGVEAFKTTLTEELAKFMKIKNHSALRRFAVQEDEKKEIAEIFERVNPARQCLALATGLHVRRKVEAIDKKLADQLPDRLKVSHMADHKHHMEGYQVSIAGRSICTPGTRVHILDAIIIWANDDSPESQHIYWLFGPAGSGKSTIAFTIARRFEIAGDDDDKAVLGGNFFCSRQFADTRHASRIVRTIVYHLALNCKAFAEALDRYGKLETVEQKAEVQLQGLLVVPWSKMIRTPDTPTFLITIDALDEIEHEGGVVFLRALLDVVNKGDLPGLKFFITSRPHPDLAAHLESFESRQVCRLEEVLPQEASADIETYLKANLPKISDPATLSKIALAANGLFIYASTVVEYLKPASRSEYKRLIKTLLDRSTPSATTGSLDSLYRQVLEEAFGSRAREDPQGFRRRLRILHSFVCTTERTSASVVSSLLCDTDDDNDIDSDSDTSSISARTDTSIADGVLRGLHAVLRVENGLVLWYHKSFPDFLFDKARSGEFYCDQREHHHLLFLACFRTMNARLHFNMANIPSSFVLDHENDDLAESVERNVSPVLSYACRSWAFHADSATFVSYEELHQLLSDFLILRVLFWLETMNLLGVAGQCHSLLTGIRQAAKELWELPLSIDRDLADATAFSLYFSGSAASLSTPHLYVSSLSTFPLNSRLLVRWRSHFPAIPKFTNPSLISETPPLMAISAGCFPESVAFSPDDSYIVCASADHPIERVKIWDANTGRILHNLSRKTPRNINRADIVTLAVSPNGKYVATLWKGSVTSEPTVKTSWLSVHNLTASSVQIFEDLEGTSIAFSPDNHQIAYPSSVGTIVIVDLFTGRIAKTLKCKLPLQAVAFSPNGKTVTLWSVGEIMEQWDVVTGSPSKPVKPPRRPRSLNRDQAFSTEDRYIAQLIDRGHSVQVLDNFTNEVLQEFKAHFLVSSVAFSSDTRRIVAGDLNQIVYVWDISGLGATDQARNIEVPAPVSIAVSAMRPDIPAHKQESGLFKDAGDMLTPVAFSQDGELLVLGTGQGLLRVLCSVTGKTKQLLEGSQHEVTSVAFSPGASRIVVCARDSPVRIWDTAKGEVVKAIDILDAEAPRKYARTSQRHAAVSPDGQLTATGSGKGCVRIWDSNWDVLHELQPPEHSQELAAVAFSPDSKHALEVRGDLDHKTSILRIWDLSTGVVQASTIVPAARFYATAQFLPDARRVVACLEAERGATFWDWKEGLVENIPFEQEPVPRIAQEAGTGTMVIALSPNGKYAAFGAEGGFIRIWNLASGHFLGRLEGHTWYASTLGLDFSSDSKYLVSATGRDKTLRVWDVAMALDPLQWSYRREKQPETFWKYTGWLVSQSGDYLMFTPHPETLPDPSNIRTFPRSEVSYVDFSKAKMGLEWTECFEESHTV